MPLLNPCCRIILMTLRATAISTGVIRVIPMVAVITTENMATHNIGTALEYICKCAAMTRQHFVAEFVQILIAVATEDIRYFQHDRSPDKSQRSDMRLSTVLCTFLTIFCVKWVYIIVLLGFLCPSIPWITLMSTPLSSKWVA